jgi:hypothetical protein
MVRFCYPLANAGDNVISGFPDISKTVHLYAILISCLRLQNQNAIHSLIKMKKKKKMYGADKKALPKSQTYRKAWICMLI